MFPIGSNKFDNNLKDLLLRSDPYNMKKWHHRSWKHLIIPVVLIHVIPVIIPLIPKLLVSFICIGILQVHHEKCNLSSNCRNASHFMDTWKFIIDDLTRRHGEFTKVWIRCHIARNRKVLDWSLNIWGSLQ